MPVHHRLRFLTFPMRTSRLCSLWPDMRPLRFRRVPFGRDVAFDPGGATASRIAMPHMLPSTVPSVSASAKLLLSWLNPPPHPITVYASHPPSPTTAQHSLPGGALPPYRGRSFTGRIASASPDAPELEVRTQSPPAASHQRTGLGELRLTQFRASAGLLTSSTASMHPVVVAPRTCQITAAPASSRLSFEPHVLHSQSVVDAVDHRGIALDIRVPAGAGTIVPEKRPGRLFRQFALDPPYQLLALDRAASHAARSTMSAGARFFGSSTNRRG